MSQARAPVEPAPGATKLYVGQIPPSGSIRDLEDLFAKYGRVLHIEIKPAGFGFIEYDDPRDAEDAVKALHEHPFEGQRLIVEFSKRASANNSTCFICGQTGHWVRDCPDNRDKGMDVRSGRCFKCGETGHLAKYCGLATAAETAHRAVTDPDLARPAAAPHRHTVTVAEAAVIATTFTAITRRTAAIATVTGRHLPAAAAMTSLPGETITTATIADPLHLDWDQGLGLDGVRYPGTDLTWSVTSCERFLDELDTVSNCLGQECIWPECIVWATLFLE
ncbi:hypothetical protein HDU86_001988 [Geranomyces michiganensis]|nr:hypothetical protein HDU86_001988 [Geranomyces michiganensis]